MAIFKSISQVVISSSYSLPDFKYPHRAYERAFKEQLTKFPSTELSLISARSARLELDPKGKSDEQVRKISESSFPWNLNSSA